MILWEYATPADRYLASIHPWPIGLFPDRPACNWRYTMPFIHIKSLPFDPPLNMSPVVEGITKDFANGTGIGLEHVTATWEFISSGNYAVAGEAQHHQPSSTHPVLVDILSPDFNHMQQVEKMLQVAAKSISEHVRIPMGNIFINHRYARSGMVFDAGKVVKW